MDLRLGLHRRLCVARRDAGDRVRCHHGARAARRPARRDADRLCRADRARRLHRLARLAPLARRAQRAAARPDARSGGGGMMRPSRTRLINAARRSMLQRGEFKRKLGIARDAFAPTALVGRARYRVGEKVDDAAHAVREEFRSNRLPIALAATAGIAWLPPEPIKENVPRLGRRLRDLADGAIDRLRPGAADTHDDTADTADREPLMEAGDAAPRK